LDGGVHLLHLWIDHDSIAERSRRRTAHRSEYQGALPEIRELLIGPD
jgi:hypothetical protein